MAKKEEKKLLNEQTVRHFMKLARLDKLSENFMSKIAEEEEEPEIEDEIPGEETPPPMEPEVAPEAAVAPEGEELVQQLITAIADAVQGVTGVSVSVEGGEGGEVEASAEMPPELPGEEEEIPEEEPPVDLDEKCEKNLPPKMEQKAVVKEEETLVSGDRVEQSADQRELPADSQVVESEEKLEEDEVVESKEFGGTKDAKMKDAPKPKKVEETKKSKMTKQQMIQEIAKRVAEKLSKKGKK